MTSQDKLGHQDKTLLTGRDMMRHESKIKMEDKHMDGTKT